MNDGTPDLATVADALAGALTPDRQAELDALLAADPAARATFARHEQTLAATSRLLASQPAPVLPASVADSLDAALRAAAAARAPIVPAARPPSGARRAVGGAVRRYVANLALAAVVIGALVLAVTQLGRPGGATSDSSAGSAATVAAAAATPATPGTAAGAAAATPTPSRRATPAGVAPRAPTGAAPAGPTPGLAGSAPSAHAGTLASGTGPGPLSAEQLPAAARALAADPAATTASCPARPGTRTLLRQVEYAGAPAWLAVTARADTLLAEVTRSVCGGALLTRTLPAG